MKDIQFAVEKIVVNAPVRQLKSRWVPVQREKIKPEFHYQRGNPAGYTDDLGIIADRNQWVESQPKGWRSNIDPQDFTDMLDWCQQNLKHDDWHMGTYYIFLKNEEDVAWFILRWS